MKYEDLKILDELREKGSISEEEYQREKEKIFNEPRSSFSKTTKKPLFGFEENTYLMLCISLNLPVPLFRWLVL